MGLQEKLDERKRSFLASGRVSAEMIAIMERSTQDLRASGITEKMRKVGQAAPSFELPNQEGRAVSSSAMLARGPLVISFFRGVW